MIRLAAIALAAATVALGAATAATAHPGGWYWTANKAATYVVNKVSVDDADVVDATCTGTGVRRRGMYHHFSCDVTDEVDRYWTVTLHPTGRSRAVAYWSECDDSDSEYYCP